MEKEKVEEMEYEVKKEIERACSDEYRLGGKKSLPTNSGSYSR
jgi:hypothetical protein